MDIFDRATVQEEKFLHQALAAHKKQNQSRGVSMKECLDCGEPIPEARRLARPGCCRCLACQQLFEGGQ